MNLRQSVSLVFIPILLNIFIPASTNANDNRKWLCNQKKSLCSKVQGTASSDDVHFENQNDCRLSCGKYGAIWPMPTGDCILGDERVHFDPLEIHFNMNAPTTESTNFMLESKDIFIQNLLKECTQNCSLAKSTDVQVNIAVKSSSLILDLNTDESYMLNVTTADHTTAIEISAETVFGARLGLETLSNLATGSMENGLLLVSSAHISDRPKFAHRGLLLDTSRNFFPVDNIRKTLDGMAASKLNVFHWHATDAQSFPLQIATVPEMTRYGAFSSTEIYSREDIEDIIKYALIRGIRVLVEISGPSNAGSGWQWGTDKQLGNLTICTSPLLLNGHLNPLNDNVYVVLKKIYQYLAKVLQPDETIHMGGNEVQSKCWQTQAISDIGFYDLWGKFHKRTLEAYDYAMKSLNFRKANAPKDVIIWSSSLTDPIRIEKYLPKERYIIQVRNPNEELDAKLRDKGYRIIMSPNKKWDLGGINYHNWGDMYKYRINQSSLMLGGEVCMWSKFVEPETMDIKMWPQAGAVAERLWSDPNSGAAKWRFYRFRERLITRGFEPAAVKETWCMLNEGKC